MPMKADKVIGVEFRCPKCHNQVNNKGVSPGKYCVDCGRELVKLDIYSFVCGGCGEAVEAYWKFCRKCGSKL